MVVFDVGGQVLIANVQFRAASRYANVGAIDHRKALKTKCKMSDAAALSRG